MASKNLVEFVASFSAKKSLSFTKAQKGMTDIQNKIDKINRKKIEPKVSSKTNNGISNLIKNLGAISVAIGGFQLLKGFIGLGIQAEQVGAQFEVLLGSASKARNKIAELQKFASETPLSPEEVLKSAKSLIAFGVDADIVIKKQRMIGDIAKATGKDFVELSLIYGKAQSQGKIYAEDLNQLTEAGIPILDELGAVMGVSAGEIKKLASKGEIGFDKLDLAMQRMTDTGGRYQGMMAKMANTTAGRWTKLTGSIQQTLTTLSEKFRPVINDTLEKLEKLWKWMTKNSEIIEIVAMTVIAIAVAYKAYSVATSLATFLTGELTLAQMALNFVMSLNVFGLIVGAIMLLVGALVIAWNKSEKFRQVIFGVWEWMKQLGMTIWDLIKTFWDFSKNILSVIFPIIGVVRTLIENWDEISDAVVDFANSAIEWVTKIGETIGEWLSAPIEEAMELWNKAKNLFTETDLGKKTLEITSKVTNDLGNAYQRGVDKSKARDAAKELAEKEARLKAKKAEEDAEKAKAEADKIKAEADKKKREEELKKLGLGTNSLSGNVDNRAQGVTSQVKNISMTIENLGNFQGATISTENLADFETQLAQALLRVANSINSI